MNDITDQDKEKIYEQVQEIKQNDEVPFAQDDQEQTQKNKEQEELYNQMKQEAKIDQPVVTVQQMIDSYPMEHFFGFKLDVDQIQNSPFDIQNLKRQLITNINSSPIIMGQDKTNWTDVLNNTNDLTVIKRIQADFEKASNRAKVDKMAKDIITMVCGYLNKNYFNGYYKFLDKITLPPMYGSEDDIINFYMSQNVQTFIQQDVRGIKIQKMMSNPVINLMFNLTMRGIKNTMKMKEQQQVQQMDYKFDNQFDNNQFDYN